MKDQEQKEQKEQKEQTGRQTIFSGIQPSGILTLGNYLGALKNWVMLQDSYDCIYCVVDMHALTVRQVPAELRRHAYEALAVYIACGIDPDKCILFVQSHVPAHAELSWILSCYTMFGELSRMTQFKDKSAKNTDNINAGLFTYPVLMAADILLYQANLVPVGDDQRQHIEITRDIAERFNGIYGPTFTVPEGYIPTTGMRIMSLTEPEKKMSKSDDNINAYISILDSRDAIMRKFRRAVTDSESSVRRGEGKDGINNLMKIYSCFTGKDDSEIEALFEGRGYGEFKTAVGEVVADALAPVKTRYDELMSDKSYLEGIMKRGAESAAGIAARTLSRVYRKIGFTQIKN
ncbi:MAG: tryptophan--tRNA ligase [Eubacteriales bacterium]|jgi:tryptophanyl-tRNA synthetase|nr:tryptophan--tRNA ligase [Eubacteriales bacterium]